MLKVIAHIWAAFSGERRALKASYRFCPARAFLLIKTRRPYMDEKSIARSRAAPIAPLFATLRAISFKIWDSVFDIFETKVSQRIWRFN